jgi:GNAT superfamily N-acetyltransferase
VPRMPKKRSARRLNREIAEALARSKNGSGNGGMARVTRERVLEPLVGERITRSEVVSITLVPAVGPEEWRLVFTRGKNYGGAQAGRILISLGGVEDPLAGLAYAVEHGRPYVHHIWVDPEARGRGFSQVLFDAYRSEVSPELVVVGPFTKAGRASAERAGATIVE